MEGRWMRNYISSRTGCEGRLLDLNWPWKANSGFCQVQINPTNIGSWARMVNHGDMLKSRFYIGNKKHLIVKWLLIFKTHSYLPSKSQYKALAQVNIGIISSTKSTAHRLSTRRNTGCKPKTVFNVERFPPIHRRRIRLLKLSKLMRKSR